MHFGLRGTPAQRLIKSGTPGRTASDAGAPDSEEDLLVHLTCDRSQPSFIWISMERSPPNIDHPATWKLV